jgi:hypothetical protein
MEARLSYDGPITVHSNDYYYSPKTASNFSSSLIFLDSRWRWLL